MTWLIMLAGIPAATYAFLKAQEYTQKLMGEMFGEGC